jgi:hypothetical protein
MGSPPAIVLDRLARADCVQELVAQFEKTTDIPAGALRSAFRFGLLDHHLLSISLTAKRPEFRAVALKAMLDGEVTWVTRYERQWADKRYGITRRVPILARRAVPRPAPVDVLIRHGAADRNSLVRRAATDGLVLHAANLTNIRSLMTLLIAKKALLCDGAWSISRGDTKTSLNGIVRPCSCPSRHVKRINRDLPPWASISERIRSTSPRTF